MSALRHSPAGLFAAVLAVMIQLVLGQAGMAAMRGAAPGVAGAHICRLADDGATPPAGEHGTPHGDMDCLACPLCAALGASVLLVPLPTDVPLRALCVRVPVADPIDIELPHRPAITAAEPRGPPALI